MSLSGKTLFITGASRGIGLAIGLRAARDGANIVIAAKTAEPHKKLPGTIYSAAEAVEKAGGQALPLVVDVREEGSVQAAVDAAVARFGGIDICVNNASAIQLTGTLATDMRRYDLMNQVNARGTFIVVARLHSASEESRQPARADAVAAAGYEPALVRRPRRLHDGEIRHEHVRARHGRRVSRRRHRLQRALAAHRHRHRRHRVRAHGRGGHEALPHAPTSSPMRPTRFSTSRRGECTGNFFIDDVLLYAEGERDFDKYRVDPSKDLMPDFFVPADCALPPGVSMGAKAQ